MSLSLTLALKVTVRNLKQVVRSPSQLGIIIIFPIVLIFMFGFIFSGSSITGEENKYSIGIINNDSIDDQWQSEFSTYVNNSLGPDYEMANTILDKGFGYYFIQYLENKTLSFQSDLNLDVSYFSSKSELQNEVQTKSKTLGLIISESFSQTILSGMNQSISLLKGSPLITDTEFVSSNTTLTVIGDNSLQSVQTVLREINKAITNFTGNFYGITQFEKGGVFRVKTSNVVSYKLTSLDYFIPGIIVFGAILGSSSIAYVVGNERALGTLDRLRLSRIKSAEYLLGLSLAQFITLTISIAVMIGTPYFIGFNGRGNPVFALVVGILSILPVIGLALIVSSLDRTGENSSSIISILSAPLGFLSGAFIPLPKLILIENIVPDGTGGLKALELWDLNPLRMAVKAERLILLNQKDLFQVLPEIGFILISGTIFFGIGALFFMKRVYSPLD